MDAKKIRKASALLAFAMILLAATLGIAKAFVEPDNWSSPVISAQDTKDTPGRTAGEDPWYDDASLSDQPRGELLYIYVDWDSTYLYVRWDVNTTPGDMKLVFYGLFLDAVAPLSDALADATHLLLVRIDKEGIVELTVRNAANINQIYWSSTNPADYSVPTPVSYDPPLTRRTAIDARFRWLDITSAGPQDIMIVRAESHFTTSDPCGCKYDDRVIDYIIINENPVPWFNGLTITLLISVGLVALLIRRHRASLIGKEPT